MSRFVVLMYHALYDGEAELAGIDAEDRPYAISVDQFARHLAAIRAAGANGTSFEAASVLACADGTCGVEGGHREGTSVLLTFDDGHASGYHHALALLERFRMRATFFVTTDFIGRREGFSTWAQLRAIRCAGHAIESHGASHRYFDDLSAEEACAELSQSRTLIEQEVGHPVRAISFPGGRYRSLSLAMGIEAGFTHFFTSQVGVTRSKVLPANKPLPRFAIRRDTDARIVSRIVSGDIVTVGQMIVTAAAKSAVRRAIGNRLYHWAYRRGTGGASP